MWYQKLAGIINEIDEISTNNEDNFMKEEFKRTNEQKYGFPMLTKKQWLDVEHQTAKNKAREQQIPIHIVDFSHHMPDELIENSPINREVYYLESPFQIYDDASLPDNLPIKFTVSP